MQRVRSVSSFPGAGRCPALPAGNPLPAARPVSGWASGRIRGSAFRGITRTHPVQHGVRAPLRA